MLSCTLLPAVVKGGGSKHKGKHGGVEHDQDFVALQRELEDVVATDPDASQFARRYVYVPCVCVRARARACTHVLSARSIL